MKLRPRAKIAPMKTAPSLCTEVVGQGMELSDPSCCGVTMENRMVIARRDQGRFDFVWQCNVCGRSATQGHAL